MNIRQLIAELKQYPQDTEVFITDDGSAWVGSWNSGIEGVSELKEGGVVIEFNGFFLRQVLDSEGGE